MRPVAVLIFHAEAPPGAGPLVRALADARGLLAEEQRRAFLAVGADTAVVIAGTPDGLSFGERLRAALVGSASGASAGGVVVLGSGSIPLARPPDRRLFVDAAAGPGGQALANNRYSADVVSISRAGDLAELPPLPADNALPRWLEERAGVTVRDLRSRWRLGVDIDTPLDLLVLRGARSTARGAAAAELRGTGADAELRGSAPLAGERLAALADVLTNRRAELLIAGRVSAATLRWLENGVACRVRALVEERGMRAASRLAQSAAGGNARPPRSALGELLDRDGPESLAALVSRLCDAAIVDTRVLIAHRSGAEDSTDATAPSSGRPGPEDRFASDLLLPARIADPWLRSLTESAVASDRPLVLGGHTMVNGGLRLLAQRASAAAR